MLPGPHLVHVLPDIWMISIVLSVMVLGKMATKDDDLDGLAIDHLFTC